MESYVKQFEVSEFSTENLYYRIEVFHRGKLVEAFERPTMREAKREFESAGYERNG